MNVAVTKERNLQVEESAHEGSTLLDGVIPRGMFSDQADG